MTIPFAKPATTYSEQVALLQSRGMLIADTAQAAFYLEQISYYRLSAYWLPYEADHATHQFLPGTRFEEIASTYSADRELRLLFIDAIERVEVSVRAHWAYQMAHRHGPHAHLKMNLARDHRKWLINLNKLLQEVDRSKEAFIQHMRATYDELLPPVWAACEVMSLGLLSQWYDNLKPTATRSAIAACFQLDQETLASWLQHLTYLRNLCAHHSRLWNRSMTITPRVSKSKPAALAGQFVTAGPSARLLYNSAVLLIHLMDTIAPQSGWRDRLRKLLTSGPLKSSSMGFPADWETRAIWNPGKTA